MSRMTRREVIDICVSRDNVPETEDICKNCPAKDHCDDMLEISGVSFSAYDISKISGIFKDEWLNEEV